MTGRCLCLTGRSASLVPMTINPGLPILDRDLELPKLSRDQWLLARHTLGHLPAGASPSWRVEALFGPCPAVPIPAVFRQQNAGTFWVSLETCPASSVRRVAARLSIIDRAGDSESTGMSVSDMRALAAALVISADYAEGRS